MSAKQVFQDFKSSISKPIMTFGCGEVSLFSVVVIEIWHSAALLCNFTLLALSFHKFLCSSSYDATISTTRQHDNGNHSPKNTETNAKGSEIKLRFKVLCVFTLCWFTCLAILIVICHNIGLLCPSKATNNIYLQIITRAVAAIYTFPLFLSYLLFAIRFIMAFEDSIIEISLTRKRILYFLSYLMLISYCSVMIIGYLIFRDNFDAFLTSLLVLGPFLVIVYTFSFVFLLKTFWNQIVVCSQSLFDNNSKKQQELFSLACRLLVCVAVSLFSSLFFQFLLTLSIALTGKNENGSYSVNTNTNQWLYRFLFMYNNFDMFVNMLCLVCQWPQFEKFYYKCICFKICDKMIARKFETKMQLNIKRVKNASNFELRTVQT